MTHLKMDKLSEREKKMVKQLLKQAYDEGGRKLEFVMRKLILTIYWAHFSTLWSDYGTVYNTLSKLLNRPGNTLKEKIFRELYDWFYDELDENITTIEENPILQDPGYIYKGISITHIRNTNINSLKPFMDALRELIDVGKGNREICKKLGLNYPPPTVDCELPF